MMTKFALIVFAFVLFAVSVNGQTESELGKISTKTVVYIRNGIQISPKFDKEGQICEAVLQPLFYFNNTVMSLTNNSVSSGNIEEILNVLDVRNERGEKSNAFFGTTFSIGQLTYETYNYENMRVSLIKPTDFGRERPEESVEKISQKGKSEFSSSKIVVVSWTKRDCSKK